MNASEAGAGREFYLAGGWVGNCGGAAASLLETLHPQIPAVDTGAGSGRSRARSQTGRGTGAH